MKVLVLGGTRFIGPHVVRQLVSAGHEVAVFNRGELKADGGFPDEVRRIIGDRAQLQSYRQQFAEYQADVVIDMFPYTESDATSMMTVFDGIADRVVAISSCDVYRAFQILNRIEDGPVERGLLTEESPLGEKRYPFRGMRDDRQDYDKVLVERVVMSSPSLPGTVLRLPMVYGPGDYQNRMYPYLKPMMDGRRYILLEEGLDDWRWTRGYVEDVAAAIVLAAEDERAKGEIFNVGESDSYSLRDWIMGIAAKVGWQGSIVTAAPDMLPPSMQLGIETSQHIEIDTGKIRRLLGFSEKVSRAEAFARTIAWESSHPPAAGGPDSRLYAIEDEILTALGKLA